MIPTDAELRAQGKSCWRCSNAWYVTHMWFERYGWVLWDRATTDAGVQLLWDEGSGKHLKKTGYTVSY